MYGTTKARDAKREGAGAESVGNARPNFWKSLVLGFHLFNQVGNVNKTKLLLTTRRWQFRFTNLASSNKVISIGVLFLLLRTARRG
jgi:hypothetical protein